MFCIFETVLALETTTVESNVPIGGVVNKLESLVYFHAWEIR
jgi:hypothetical protein